MDGKKPVGRFAPSPSGRMHLGNVFSALLSWLSVRSQDGEMILRIEDLDPGRCKKEYAEQLKDDLLWLGLDWDREQMPQSMRTEAYREQFEKLDRLGLLYPCYCTRGELHAASAPHASDGTAIYAGTCRSLTPSERAAKTRMPCWRVKVPRETISFCDGLQREVSQQLDRECGDFIVRRSDEVYAYQLAVVTDDADGGVTEIVRGADLLSSVPRQIFLQRTLGFPTPNYYHVPLLLSPTGARLSKRDRAADFGLLRETQTPEHILGKLAFLAGLLPQEEKVSLQELLSVFSWSRIKKENITVF